MPGPLNLAARRAGLLAALLAGAAIALTPGGDLMAAPARKAPAKKPAAAAAKPGPPAPPKPREPPPPLEIKCGAPLKAPKPAPKGLARIKGMIHAPPKLPDICVLARFKDPAFPVIDPNAPSTAIGLYGPSGLFGGRGPVEAVWTSTLAEFQGVADEIADYGPRPSLRATVRLNDLMLVESHAVFDGPPGHGGVIVLSTQLVDSLIALSKNANPDDPEKSNAKAQQYLKFVIAHEYAHLVLNHPQQLAKSESFYKQLGQAFQMAGMIYAVANGVSANKASYLEQQQKAKQSAGVMLGAMFAGEAVSVEGTRFLFPIFNRSVERDADMLAVDILKRTTRSDPLTGVEGLQVFYKENEDNIRRNSETQQQAKRTASLAATTLLGVAPALMQGDSSQAIKNLKVMAITAAADLALRKLEEHRMMVDAHLHDSPVERAELVHEYVGSFYDDAEQTAVAPQSSALAGLMAADAKPAATPAASGRIVHDVDFKKIGAEAEGHHAAERAKVALAKGDVPAARVAIDEALASPIKNSIEVRMLAGGVANAEGKPDEAIGHFRAVLAAGYHGSEIYKDIAQAQRAKPDLDGALKTLADGATVTSQSEAFILLQMDIHRVQKDDAAVQADLKTCEGFKDVRLLLLCQQTAMPDKTSPADPRKVADDGASTPPAADKGAKATR